MLALVIGAQGQLGRQLINDLPIAAIGITRADLDLGLNDRSEIKDKLNALLDKYQPDLIFNAAAYTAVDQAESAPELAEQINGWFPGLLASCAKMIPIVHFSTDYVFDGHSDHPYSERDMPNPLSVYGRTKWLGEQSLFEQTTNGLVVRCSWVVGPWGQNFVKTILRLALTKTSIRVVNDQWGVPTPCRFLVRQIDQWLNTSMPFGLFHVVPGGMTTWFDYANLIVERATQHPAWRSTMMLRTEGIEPIEASKFPSIAKRPKNSLLDTGNWRHVTQQSELEPWLIAISPVLDEILDQS